MAPKGDMSSPFVKKVASCCKICSLPVVPSISLTHPQRLGHWQAHDPWPECWPFEQILGRSRAELQQSRQANNPQLANRMTMFIPCSQTHSKERSEPLVRGAARIFWLDPVGKASKKSI